MYKIFADKLFDFTDRYAEEIAKQWCKSIRTNPRTLSYRSLPDDKCLSQAVSCYKNLKPMCHDEKPYEQAWVYFRQYAEASHAEGIPLHESIYALIMMRRHIWLSADLHALFASAIDLHQAIECINRVVLLFDYATYILAERYHEMGS
jgi:hypothetical protein